MVEMALKSFLTFFVTIGPIEAAVLFATLTPKMPYDLRRGIAIRATLIASCILAVFTLFGEPDALPAPSWLGRWWGRWRQARHLRRFTTPPRPPAAVAPVPVPWIDAPSPMR